MDADFQSWLTTRSFAALIVPDNTPETWEKWPFTWRSSCAEPEIDNVMSRACFHVVVEVGG